MFRIYMVSKNEFIVNGFDQTFTGNEIETIAYLVRQYIDEDQINIGMKELVVEGNHVADYGGAGTFIYAEKIA